MGSQANTKKIPARSVYDQNVLLPLGQKKNSTVNWSALLTLSTRISYFTRLYVIVLVTPWKSKQLSWNKCEVISCHLRVNTYPNSAAGSSTQQSVWLKILSVCNQPSIEKYLITYKWFDFPLCCVQPARLPSRRTPLDRYDSSFSHAVFRPMILDLAIRYAIKLLISCSF